MILRTSSKEEKERDGGHRSGLGRSITLPAGKTPQILGAVQTRGRQPDKSGANFSRNTNSRNKHTRNKNS